MDKETEMTGIEVKERDEKSTDEFEGKSEEECDETDSGSEKMDDAETPPKEKLPPKQRIQYKCDDCSRQFCRKRDLLAHMARHTGQKLFKCTQCGLSFARKDNLKKHNCCGSKDLFNCHVCGRSYTHRGYLLMHLKSAHADRRLTCTVCARTFVLNSHLLSHKCFHVREVQGGKEQEQRNECALRENNQDDSGERSQGELRERDQESELEERSQGEQRQECELETEGLESKKVKGRESHEEDKDPTNGGKDFEGSELKKEETTSRKKETQFICSVCGKIFAHNASLYRHARTHTGERPHSCPLCSKTFPWPGDLKRHMKYHQPTDRPFVCEICGRAFIVNEALISHRRTHSNTKPFSCSVCGKGFTRRHQLQEHVRLHTTEYCCPECGQKYRKQGALHNHVRKHHRHIVTTEMEKQQSDLDEDDTPDTT